MGKGRKQQVQDYQFDEASSGSDDDSEIESHPVRRSLEDNDIHRGIQKDPSGEDSDNDDDDDDANVDSSDKSTSSSDDSDDGKESNTNDGLDSDNDSPDFDRKSDHEQEDDSSDEEDAPLHERLQKKEGRGSLQRLPRRERKSRALEEATKRLAAFKETKQKKKKGIRIGGGGDDDERIETSSNKKNKQITESTTTKKKKKKSKHRPTEVSSKRADFFARGARRLNESGLGVDIGAHRYKPLDPRASNLSGHFDEDRFNENYAFLEEMRNREIGQVRKRIAAHKATGNKGNRLRKKLQIIQADGSHSSTLEEDVTSLKTLTETRANLERRKIDIAAKRSVKRKIRDDVESGKTGAYFLKRKEMKRLELEARFEGIRERGGEKAVEKILAKKRQKNKSRDAGAFAK